MHSKLSFGAHFVYAVRGTSEESQRSYRMRNAFKAGKFYDRALDLMVANGYDHAPFLGPEVVLVPAPRRAPTRPGDLWPAVGICDELVRRGLAAGWHALLERRTIVSPSHGVVEGHRRPSPEDHYNSLVVTKQLIPSAAITLVDDFVTRGSTALGCATALKEAYPDLEIRLFGLARTISSGEIDSIEMPCRGAITYTPGTNVPHRDP